MSNIYGEKIGNSAFVFGYNPALAINLNVFGHNSSPIVYVSPSYPTLANFFSQ